MHRGKSGRAQISETVISAQRSQACRCVRIEECCEAYAAVVQMYMMECFFCGSYEIKLQFIYKLTVLES